MSDTEQLIRNKPGIHIVPTLRGKKRWWAVRYTGSLKASRVLPTSADAYEYAKPRAERDRATLWIHDEGGRILSHQRFGRESLASLSSLTEIPK